MKQKKPKSAPGSDNVLFEIGSHAGDHAVAEVPPGQIRRMEHLLKDAGVKKAKNISPHSLPKVADRLIEKEGVDQLTYRKAKIFDGDENLEDNGDREGIDEREPNDDGGDSADYVDSRGIPRLADCEPEVIEADY